MHHIVSPGAESPQVVERLRKDEPDVVVFGHTHKPYARQHDTRLYFNPGYAGRKRFNLERSVAIIEIAEDGPLSWRFVPLDP